MADTGSKASGSLACPRPSGEAAPSSSPPCYLPEVDPAYFGWLDSGALLAHLDRLIEGERAGAHGLARLLGEVADPLARTVLRELAHDEARCCARLVVCATRLGGTPSRAVGGFATRLSATVGLDARLRLLDRGQAAVVREIDALLPRVGDPALALDLRWVRELHVANLARGRALLADLPKAEQRGRQEQVPP